MTFAWEEKLQKFISITTEERGIKKQLKAGNEAYEEKNPLVVCI
ncbi:hypothetical protein [Alteribacillus sp. YIM 98480]|nr:hypothetical protein [Alteribacillus sp. YIM 98480]